MRDVTQLHPELQGKIAELKRLWADAGLNVAIGECLRTAAEQDKIYAKGRTDGTVGTLTNAKGADYGSVHQWGLAFDFCRNDKERAFDDSDGFFRRAAELAKQKGLSWGGDWKNPVDKPHLQLETVGGERLITNGTTSELKKRFGTPENFMKTWEEWDMQKRYKSTEEIRADKELGASAKVYADELDALIAGGVAIGRGGSAGLDLTEDMVRNLIYCSRIVKARV
ncbi:MAG: M15 family metallopeptidase [Oscillospiraceae bacterium]|jgi:hypothetical protein|nr:M15 family metallopeptidase [Oscillospiraceae bacterium]